MKKQKNISKFHLRNDIFFITLLFLISAIGVLYLFVFRSGGNVVKVTVDGEIYGIYSLSVDVTEDIISGEDGSGLNRLVIRDGKAHIESATCPDGICVDHPPIFKSGESIVCLPNRVVVTAFTDNVEDAPDIVA